jgi:hypothetical protein
MNDAPDLVASEAARLAALDALLGPGREQLFHAPVPLVFGGKPDVVRYAVDGGVVYVTSGLLELGSPLDHELAFCLRQDDRRAPAMMGNLGQYAYANPIKPGETMDLTIVDEDSSIRGLIFARWEDFPFDGRPCHLLLAIGITGAELEFKHVRGGEALLERLHAAGVAPFTDPSRSSVL